MIIVFRVINGDYFNKEIVALCSDLETANSYVQYLVSCDDGDDTIMYVVGSDADI